MLEVFIFFRETNQCHELEELGSPIVYQGIKYVQSSLMFWFQFLSIFINKYCYTGLKA